jgi:hypothetical protein
MTPTVSLADLLAQRNAALEAISGPPVALRNMAPADQLRCYVASETFRETDARIVMELRQQPGPVRVGGVVLHLTRDRLNFVSLDPETGRPVYVPPSDHSSWTGILYRYPVGKQNAPSMVL